MPKERIETNAAKTTVVRVARPTEASPAGFVNSMRAWLDHQCILLVDLKAASSLENAEDLFDAEFDNPRDAELFARRFGGEPVLPRTSRRAGRNNPGQLLQFRRRLKAQKEGHPLDRYASAIVDAGST